MDGLPLLADREVWFCCARVLVDVRHRFLMHGPGSPEPTL
jgi:hypothetical protein